MTPGPPPDFVGYENLIHFIDQHKLCRLNGDFVEIGAFMGGGTVKLADYARKWGKTVYVIDIFEPARDQTVSRSGITAQTVYEAFLEGRSMRDVYQVATRDYDNIITICQDSRTVRFTRGERFVFAFIDGCHSESFVRNDFDLLWPHVVSGGMLGFHDYQYEDWPGVTHAAKALLQEHCDEITETAEIAGAYDIRSLMLIKR